MEQDICPSGGKSMNKQITFSVALGVALLSACASLEAKPPTCTQPVGKWKNHQKSVLEIKTYDTVTGAISGQYTSRSGAGSWPMQISTLWHTTRPNTEFEWDHTLTGSEVFVPIE